MIIKVATLQRFTFVLLPLCPLVIGKSELLTYPSICLFKYIFGTECFGCGITKALWSLYDFEFVAAFHHNKLVILVAPILAFAWLKAVYKELTFLTANK